MKKEGDPFLTALCISLGITLGLVFASMLISYLKEQPTNTTKHQPEPTEQYADSLVCPD